MRIAGFFTAILILAIRERNFKRAGLRSKIIEMRDMGEGRGE
jgi:hypothetical protein